MSTRECMITGNKAFGRQLSVAFMRQVTRMAKLNSCLDSILYTAQTIYALAKQTMSEVWNSDTTEFDYNRLQSPFCYLTLLK